MVKRCIQLTLGLISFSLLAACVLSPMKASAISGNDFKAGRIIDDSLFYDGSAMSAGQIQTFLNSKVPQCDTNGTKEYKNTGLTRAEWAQANGEPSPPYVCLKDFKQDTPFVAGESGLCAPITAKTNRTAAQIIDDVSRACNVSQKAIIVMLQKEQGFITDDWPWPIQYTKAMGYYCPDDPNNPGWCHPDYAGFFRQIYNAALQFQKYKANPDGWGHIPFATNNVLFQANKPSCGSSAVYIENYATAGLYNYTPYQPNAAALAAGYGTGDGCSAYGNRNFWLYYNDWFGSTYAVNESWSLVSQELFSDSSKKLYANPEILSPGHTYFARIRAKNTGPAPWVKGEVNLATSSPQDRNSMFCNDSWLTCNRPAGLKESSVAPGEIGTFEFPVIMPSGVSSFKEYFRPVVEGITWMTDIGMHWTFSVKDPTNHWKFISQSVYSDSGHDTAVNYKVLSPDRTYYVKFNVMNYGNTTWSAGKKINLGTSSPQDRSSAFCDNSWLTCNRPAKLKQSSVKPGEIGTFEFSIRTPSSYGDYKEYFRPVSETSGWMTDIGMNLPMHVKKPTYDWSYVNQKLYTNDSKTTPKSATNIAGNARYYAVINIKNTGNVTWRNSGSNPMRLGTSNPNDRSSKFCDSTWQTLSPSCNRPAKLKQSSVKPGEIGTFEFWIKAPYSVDDTKYKEYFRPVVDSVTWLKDIGLHYSFKMNSPDYTYGYVDQAAFTNSSRSTPANLLNASNNKTYYLTLRIRNTGGKIWSNSGASPLRLGTSSPQDRSSAFCDNSWLTCNRPAKLKQSSVKPGEIGTFEFSIKTPSTGSDDRSEYFRPVVEGLQWMTDIGIHYRIVY